MQRDCDSGREADWERRAADSGDRLTRVLRGDALAGGVATGAAAALAAGAAVAMAAVAIPAVATGEVAGVLLAALVLLAIASLEAVAPLGAAAASIDAVADAAARLEAVTERPPPVRECKRPLPGAGALELRDVRFGHDRQAPWVLDGIDLRLEPGRSVALVGPSGAGKTTLAELLVRFRDPNEGTVALGGVDACQLDGGELRRAVRIAAQDAHLFATTIRENVGIARPDVSEGRIRAALSRAGLDPWIDSLADGLATYVGESGAQVSGGQRQRIAAARLLVADARFLIFDEPTTHLDPAGAESLLAELARATDDGKAVLVITHERSRVGAFDAVVELREGRISR